MTDFDRLVGRAPANVTAAQVTGRGEHWEPATPMLPDMLHWKAPPLMKRFVADIRSPEQVDLTGAKFGRFVVVGFLADDGGKNRGGRWVCRCVCGDFEARSTKAIRLAMTMPEGRSNGAQCWYCRQWSAAQQRYKKLGSRAVSHFTKSQDKVIKKVPEEIIATRLAAIGSLPHAKLARTIISDLQKHGYQIVRQKNQSSVDATNNKEQTAD